MILQFIFGTILIAITVIVHAIALEYLIKFLEIVAPKIRMRFSRHWKMITITFTVIGVFCANICEIWLWASFYYFVGAQGIQDFETALYFSTSSFTTVGYGDVHLEKDWRLLGSFESANGMILFGWSTAFIFDVISKLYKNDHYGDKAKD